MRKPSPNIADLFFNGVLLDDLFGGSYMPSEVLPNRVYCGIEIEAENFNPRALDDKCFQVWRADNDGSLRNDGVEFILRLPMVGKNLEHAINSLFEYLPPSINFSERTSIHVHLDVRKWTRDQLLNLIILYLCFEKLFYQFAGKLRYYNLFCVPIQETMIPTRIRNNFSKFTINSLINYWGKYSGLNLLRITDYGSVEYRHMVGHRDKDYLINWINLLMRLHLYAEKYTYKELFSKIKVLNTSSTYEAFVVNVFENDARLLMESNLKENMEPGVSTVKCISRPSKFISQLLRDRENMLNFYVWHSQGFRGTI